MNRTRIRVVVVAHGPPLRGGIATVAMDIVGDPALNDEFEIVFVNTSQNEDARGRLSLANVRRMLGDAVSTFRAARRGAVVHTHSVQEPWTVAWRQVGIALAARLRGASVVLHNHAATPYMCAPGTYHPGRLNEWGLRVLDLLAAENILLAPCGARNMSLYFSRAGLPVVGNSVIVAGVPRSGADHDPPVVLFIGELLERKGVRTLLDALDGIDRRGAAHYELRVIGNDTKGLDPAKDRMIDEVHRRGRASALTGPLDRTEVYRHLSESDVFVLPTDYEGQPFAVIEALAAGVPVVATDIPSIASMFDDPTNGRLVSRTDTAGFTAAIEALLLDVEGRSRISEANRALAETRYDRAVFRDSLAALYRHHGRAGGGHR